MPLQPHLPLQVGEHALDSQPGRGQAPLAGTVGVGPLLGQGQKLNTFRGQSGPETCLGTNLRRRRRDVWGNILFVRTPLQGLSEATLVPIRSA